MPFGLPEILGLGTSIAGGFIGANAAESDSRMRLQGQREANATNIRLAREQRDWNYEMWRRQSRYNLPVNQMRRLKAAGLNPHLMYGQGTVGNAEQVRGYDRASVENEARGYKAMEGIIGNAMQAVQSSNIIANTQVAKQEAINKALEAQGKTYENVVKANQAGVSKELTKYQVQAAKHNADKVFYDSSVSHWNAEKGFLDWKMLDQSFKSRLQKVITEGENARRTGQLQQFEIDLNKLGFTKSDNKLIRVLGNLFVNGQLDEQAFANLVASMKKGLNLKSK